MKGKRIVLTCAIAAMTVSMGAMANEIYKWTDADGNVHYEDRPSGAVTEERLDLTYRSTDRGAVQARVKTRLDAQTAREEAESTAAAAEQQRRDRCDQARARLETYLQARRLYRTDDNGERVYLDDSQSQQARQKAEEQIAEFCS